MHPRRLLGVCLLCLPLAHVLEALFLEQWMLNSNGSFRMDPRRPIGATASFVDLLDVSEGNPILYRMVRYRSLQPIVVSAGGDPQNATHYGNRVIRLLFLYERKYDCRVPSVSWAKKAAAFFNISRSIRRMRFSARSFLKFSSLQKW